MRLCAYSALCVCLLSRALFDLLSVEVSLYQGSLIPPERDGEDVSCNIVCLVSLILPSRPQFRILTLSTEVLPTLSETYTS